MTTICSYLSQIAQGSLPEQLAADCECRDDLLAIIEQQKTLQMSIQTLQASNESAVAETKRVRELKRLYRSVFENYVLGIIIINREGKIIDANQSIEYMLGFSVDELKTMDLRDVSLPEDYEIDRELHDDVIEGRRTYYQIEKRYVRNNGILFWGMVTVSVIWNDAGEPIIINMVEDISARKSAELQLSQMSIRDSLTGLYNRSYFDSEFSRLQFIMMLPVSIIVIDVDGLKLINDSKGHEAGDKLISSVASILKDAFRGDDIVARIGGDEFSVLLPETNEDATKIVCERVRKCQGRFNETNADFTVNFSMGAATAYKGSDIPAALKRADERMYADKLLHKGTRANP